MEQLGMLAGIKAGDPDGQLGLTDAIRWVVGTAEGAITASEIKDRLTGATYINLPADPMPSILTVLRRLITSEEINPYKKSSGTTYYQWVGGLPPTPPAPKRKPQSAGDALLEIGQTVGGISTMAEEMGRISKVLADLGRPAQLANEAVKSLTETQNISQIIANVSKKKK